MNLIISIGLALSILASSLTAFADKGASSTLPRLSGLDDLEFPSMAITIKNPAGQPVKTVYLALIPKRSLKQFVIQFLKDDSTAHPVEFVYSDKDSEASFFDQFLPHRKWVSSLKVPKERLAEAEENVYQMVPISLQDMTDASLMVITVNLGILAPSLIYSSSTAWSFLASFAFIAAQVIANDRGKFITNYITWAAKKAHGASQEYFPKNPFITDYINWGNRDLSDEQEKKGWSFPEALIPGILGTWTGRASSAMSYSFFSNSWTKYFLNGFNPEKSLGSAAGRLSVEKSVVSSFFSSSIWDIFFSKLRNKTEEGGVALTPSQIEENQKIAQILVWGKTLYLFTLGPMMLSPYTEWVGYSATSALAVLGLYAHYNGEPFIKMGRIVLRKFETDPRYNYAFTSALSKQKEVMTRVNSMARDAKTSIGNQLMCGATFSKMMTNR